MHLPAVFILLTAVAFGMFLFMMPYLGHLPSADRAAGRSGSYVPAIGLACAQLRQQDGA